MRRSSSSYLKLLAAKKVRKNSRNSCNIFFHSLSPSPTLSIFHFPLSLSIFSPFFLCLTYTCIYRLSSHALTFYLRLSIPPLSSSLSQSSSALPLFLLATLFWERTGSQSRLLLARVVRRQIKNGWTCRAPVLFSCIKWREGGEGGERHREREKIRLTWNTLLIPRSPNKNLSIFYVSFLSCEKNKLSIQVKKRSLTF